jgi:hypothetical protein
MSGNGRRCASAKSRGSPKWLPRRCTLEPPLHRRTARRVVAAEAHRHHADPIRVDVGAARQIVEAGAACHLVIRPQHQSAKADRLPRPRPIHHQARDAAAHQLGHAAHELQLLGDVEPVEEYHRRTTLERRVLGLHEVTGQAPALVRNLDRLDPRAVGQPRELAEALHRGGKNLERSGVLRRPEPLPH